MALRWVVLLMAGTCVTMATTNEDLPKLVENAAKKSNLTMHGSPPFHMKIIGENKALAHPEFRADIEIWWAAPNKWRREIKSPAFTQTAILNGEKYFESNSSDYIPWWLDELTAEALDPVPVLDANPGDVEFAAKGCAKWESEYVQDAEKVTVYNSMCFDPDGTMREAFTRSASTELGGY